MHASPRPVPDGAPFLPWAVVGCLLIAVAIVFGQTLWFGFLDYDDPVFVTDCPQVQTGLTGNSISWAFTAGPAGEWYPLSVMSHMLDCQMFGLHAWGHHLTNLTLHAATALVLFLVLRSMTAELWPSAMVAAIFAVHPQHVESVAWIAERRDVLSGLLFVLTLGAYVGYVRHGRTLGRYLLVVVLLALGLMAKSMLVTLPPLLLLLDYWPLGRFGRAADLPTVAAPDQVQRFWPLVLEKLPLAALAAADIVATLGTKAPQHYDVSWTGRLANAAVATAAYLGQFLFPEGLSVGYPYPEVSWPVWMVGASLALLLLLSVAVVLARRALPYLLVGWFWYLLLLVPVLGLVLIGPHSRADRYTYLSQIGLAIAVVWGATRLAERRAISRRLLAAGAAALLLTLMACSWRQAGFWRSDQALWQHALDCNPDNVYAHYIFAATLERAGDLDGAADHYRQAVERLPREQFVYWLVRAESHNALGYFAERAGNVDQAVDHYQAALKWQPKSLSARLNLGRMQLVRGQLDQAIDNFRQCVELNPRDPRPYCGLAATFARQGDIAQATTAYRRALEVAPGFGPAVRGLQALAGQVGPEASGQP